jgi:hypothetical protein
MCVLAEYAMLQRIFEDNTISSATDDNILKY